ncbi:prevent-host-death family protein (plasmid) [Staphylococcus capitis subsp. capitis]|jgi:antitoxin YefM|uniref:type II toxin-antitoxin system Phd/YefM family antitoxin n=1 Tax=Staphylococcus capitis TaxID=29388 RepID=UPI00064AED02|nr:type II toxin-antitoxin system Phd/YefM family antitoxin [Staphylococcus capitis]AKL93474.1 prevent-host-death family protein [Staphylococcus capitis subsp. capitis]
MIIKNPTDARKEFYQLLKNVNDKHEPVFINGKNKDNDAVIIAMSDWKSMQETIYLEATGTMDQVREREKYNNGSTNVDDIDWDNL